MTRRRAITLLAWVGLACVLAAAPAASGAAKGSPGARSAHSPQVPPLVSGAFAYASPSGSHQPAGEPELEPESAAGSEDQLVRNGLDSPLCRLAGAELSASAARNCRTSRFVAAGPPSEDYSFDTNIDTTLGVSVDALIQDYVIRSVWIALVWLVHALLVALEWAYEIDLLRSSLTAGLSRALLAAEAQFTRPWLASTFAVAAVLAAYHGLVRRQVAQTLGEVAAMLAMVGSAMFVIADPSGTIGALSQWANGASIGTFGAVASGSSARPYAALAGSMQELYEAAIEAPWCFLEFGDVGWCDQPARLDPRLHKAALRIAGQIEGEARTAGPRSGVAAEVLANRAQLLRQAQTNGQIFLALPANGPLRNSVKESDSLFYLLCGGGEDATSCRGPTAAEAEFRANAGTLPRLGGVLVIAMVVLGMLALFASIAVRLLEAAILSVLFLLLAPVAALAPTLGETGRSAFRRWAACLLGVVAAKLLWSVVLGALLATTRVVLGLQGLGWLLQWLLAGMLWWGAFFKRRSLLEAAGARSPRTRPTLVRRVGEQVGVRFGRETGRSVRRLVVSREMRHGAAEERRKPARADRLRDLLFDLATGEGRRRRGGHDRHPDGGHVPRSDAGHDRRSDAGHDRRPDAGHGQRRADPPAPAKRPTKADALAPSPPAQADPASASPRGGADALRERLSRLQAAHAEALAGGDRRRATSLELRRRRVMEQIERSDIAGASPTAAAATTPTVATTRTAAATTTDRDRRDAIAKERAMRDELRDPVMRDAFEVACRRKRQLGWSWRDGE